MPCYHPVAAYQKAPGAVLNFARSAPHNIHVPCGKCLGCKQAAAQAWGIRSLHETARSPYNTFVTLTYNDDHLPESSHIRWRDVQLLLKRLRKSATSDRNPITRDPHHNIRYLACAEYGPTTQRPHYHLILYNCAFADQFKVGKDLYDSLTLQQLWADQNGKPMGAARIAPATYERAVYIGKYTFKDKTSANWTRWRGQGGGEVNRWGEWRPRPRAWMSLRPAIAKDWIAKYWQDLEHGYLIHNGNQIAIPRYYRKWVDQNRPYFRALVAESIQRNAEKPTDSRDEARLLDAEKIHQRRKDATQRRNL